MNLLIIIAKVISSLFLLSLIFPLSDNLDNKNQIIAGIGIGLVILFIWCLR